MRIRLGDFAGQSAVAPTVPSTGNTAAAFVTPDSGLGDTAQRVAGGLLAKDRAEQERQQRELDAQLKRDEEQARRNKAASSFANYQVDAQNLSFDVGSQLTDGKISPEDATKNLQQGLDELKKKYISPLDPESQSALSDNVTLFDGRANLNLRQALQTRAKQDRVEGFNNTVEALQRLALTDRPGAVERAQILFQGEGKALFGADKAGAALQKFKEGVAVSDYSNQILANRKSIDGLSQVEKKIQADQELDPEKKTVLIGRTMSMRDTLQAKAQRAEETRLRRLQSSINQVNGLILKGYDPTPEQMLPLVDAAKGTELEGAAKSMVATANATNAFRSLPPAGQEAAISDFEQKVRSNPTPGNVNTLEHLKTIFHAQQVEIQNDPISFAARKGLADIQPLDFQHPATMGDQLAARLDVARGMKGKYGAPLRVLTTEEAKALSGILNQGTSADKVRFLGTLHGAITDPGAYQATMQQLAPDSPVTAFAGQLIGRGEAVVASHWFSPDAKVQANDVAQRMLRGDALLNPSKADKAQDGNAKGFQIGAEKDFNTYFNAAAGKAFPGAESQRVRDTYYQATKAVYADLASEAGDRNGIVDSARVKKAFQMVTGGGVVHYGDSDVIPPFGMSGDTLKTRVKQQFKQAIAQGHTSVSPSYIDNASLYQVGDGRYLVEMGGRFLPDQKAHGPLVIDVNLPTPWESSGQKGS